MGRDKGTVLVVDDEQRMRELLAGLLEPHGYRVETAADGQEALAKAGKRSFDFIITDLKMPGMDGFALLDELQARGIDASVLVVSAHDEIDNRVQVFDRGAVGFIAKPFQREDEVLLWLESAARLRRLARQNRRLQQEVEDRFSFHRIIGKSEAMQAVFRLVAKIADYKTSVLVTGESGTGKELVARAIHYSSSRRRQPLVAVNCGGIPETLLESELFGHEKGAFTDAYRAKKGLFQEADGGTLFLDEIGELSLPLQVKLLRALQEEEIRPLGASRTVKVDVRIIAATARNLRQEVERGGFREDLFYRINVLAVELPPLRRRKEDIPLLVDHFIGKYNERLGLAIRRMEPECMKRILAYHWPGNVRELENVVERAMVLAEGEVLTADTLPPEILEGREPGPADFLPEGLSIKKNAKAMERRLIALALEKTGGNKTRAAELLEISLPALLYKMKEYGLAPAKKKQGGAPAG